MRHPFKLQPDCIAVFLRWFDEKTYAIYKTAPPGSRK